MEGRLRDRGGSSHGEVFLVVQKKNFDTMTALVFDESQFTSLEAYVDALNTQLEEKTAQEIVQWTFDTFGARTVLSSSFGIQSAVMLHLTRSVSKDIPVVWVDTGYLPKETYQFAAHLTKLLDLNVRVYQSPITPARMEALYGKLYEIETPEAHRQYGYMRKVEPMQRALDELNAAALLVGVRADQTQHRQHMKHVNVYEGRLKICPILNWSKQEIEQYMTANQLEYHPLKAQGYESVGDAHSSRPVTEADKGNDRAGRFNGKQQECGLHLDMHGMKLEDLKFDDPLALSERDLELLKLTKQAKGITIFTKPTCKYCLAAKDVMREREWEFDEVSVPTEVSIQSLKQIVGQSVTTVPQIFLDGKYIGGYTEFVAHLGIPSLFA
ncbi:phosphoadenosine phosphosulfate reductase [Phytophthora infestans T30-4]|uniref:Phosphoadenosine phosphosulfate reductase n=1 Tax=Phytophthora infestans (strain T30-4) TaxID=403677 RepID=D0N1L8_PHYIT|nr:phosphoadenosine phosphosulfate reductase [Phytophthora infestans T30-4]EEY68197.1 phosphoadenosine phosphosulfate reductase [Phytophthora infestans T30-4]|eukprot:XP_002905356.1 phosphoadenosine phosphosulfate reductase [Phytophthora infestans T30-4]